MEGGKEKMLKQRKTGLGCAGLAGWLSEWWSSSDRETDRPTRLRPGDANSQCPCFFWLRLYCIPGRRRRAGVVTVLLEDRPSFWVGGWFQGLAVGRQAARVLEIIEVMKHWEEGDERGRDEWMDGWKRSSHGSHCRGGVEDSEVVLFSWCWCWSLQ